MKLTRLDRRHTGWGEWKYSAERQYGVPLSQFKMIFWGWREWCWGTWGPSKELFDYTVSDLFDGVLSSNNHWCWNIQDQKYRIYLRGDTEAELFLLKWM
jgi:hypothetical protein